MAHVLISYDVSSKQIDMKNTLKASPYNYNETMKMDSGTIYNLPSTTLWKANSNSAQAKADMLAAAKYLNITLTKAIAVEFSIASGV